MSRVQSQRWICSEGHKLEVRFRQSPSLGRRIRPARLEGKWCVVRYLPDRGCVMVAWFVAVVLAPAPGPAGEFGRKWYQPHLLTQDQRLSRQETKQPEMRISRCKRSRETSRGITHHECILNRTQRVRSSSSARNHSVHFSSSGRLVRLAKRLEI